MGRVLCWREKRNKTEYRGKMQYLLVKHNALNVSIVTKYPDNPNCNYNKSVLIKNRQFKALQEKKIMPLKMNFDWRKSICKIGTYKIEKQSFQ